MRTMFCSIFSLILSQLIAQSPVGVWKTIDDNSGKPKSFVEIFEKDGKLHGEVVKIIDPAKADKLCTECSGSKKNKPIMGLEILWDLEKDGDEWGGGSILDPNNGKVYSCYVELESNDKLKVRGYLGFSLLGRSQYWERVE